MAGLVEISGVREYRGSFARDAGYRQPPRRRWYCPDSSFPRPEEPLRYTGTLPMKRPGEASLDEQLPLVYEELRKLAAAYLRRERPGHTLQPTCLVHEAYLRLASQRAADWSNRAQLIGLAASMMRRILVNYAESRNAEKRGGQAVRMTLEEGVATPQPLTAVDLLGLDQALNELADFDAECARIVEMKYFGGLQINEIATVLGVSERTVERQWRTARAWLFARLSA